MLDTSLDQNSPSSSSSSSSGSPLSKLSNLSLPELPPMNTNQWGQLGAGAALALVGSGLVSLGTLVRLAAVVGGSVLAYRTWTSVQQGGGSTASSDAADDLGVDTTPLPTSASLAPRASLRDTLLSGDTASGSLTSLEDAEKAPVIDLRGA